MLRKENNSLHINLIKCRNDTKHQELKKVQQIIINLFSFYSVSSNKHGMTLFNLSTSVQLGCKIDKLCRLLDKYISQARYMDLFDIVNDWIPICIGTHCILILNSSNPIKEIRNLKNFSLIYLIYNLSYFLKLHFLISLISWFSNCSHLL